MNTKTKSILTDLAIGGGIIAAGCAAVKVVGEDSTSSFLKKAVAYAIFSAGVYRVTSTIVEAANPFDI
ncbi:MAG: hypothetical protein M0R77_00435 [Gammaproteobacteria bacterium]|nr:hypothetical protein [Acholeplasmataceae bacterium]MCK9529021.1 hypothetical protein [Gammaproteobacteria bacterium]